MLQYSLNNLYTPQKWEKFKKVTRCINDLLLLNICSSNTRELRLVSSHWNRNLFRTVFVSQKHRSCSHHIHTHAPWVWTLTQHRLYQTWIVHLHSGNTRQEKQPENHNSGLTNQPFLLRKNIKLKSLKEQKRGGERLRAARLDSDKRLI